MSTAMGTGMQVVIRCIPMSVLMLKRRGDWMKWNCCLQLLFVLNLHGCMESWHEKKEDIHSNDVFFYVIKQQIVQPVLYGEH